MAHPRGMSPSRPSRCTGRVPLGPGELLRQSLGLPGPATPPSLSLHPPSWGPAVTPAEPRPPESRPAWGRPGRGSQRLCPGSCSPGSCTPTHLPLLPLRTVTAYDTFLGVPWAPSRDRAEGWETQAVRCALSRVSLGFLCSVCFPPPGLPGVGAAQQSIRFSCYRCLIIKILLLAITATFFPFHQMSELKTASKWLRMVF